MPVLSERFFKESGAVVRLITAKRILNCSSMDFLFMVVIKNWLILMVSVYIIWLSTTCTTTKLTCSRIDGNLEIKYWMLRIGQEIPTNPKHLILLRFCTRIRGSQTFVIFSWRFPHSLLCLSGICLVLLVYAICISRMNIPHRTYFSIFINLSSKAKVFLFEIVFKSVNYLLVGNSNLKTE